MMSEMYRNEKGQMVAPPTVPMTEKAYGDQDYVSVYWLGGGGAMINSCGTVLMIDPLMKGFDMPLLQQLPAQTETVPHVDGILVSHVDNDHYSRPTLRDLKDRTDEVHTSYYVASLMKEECGIPNAVGHTWHDELDIKNIHVTVTPADHNWQNAVAKYQYRVWEKEEYFGFYLRTEGKKIWYVGDSRLMEEQLHQEAPDLILFDFADNPVHIGLADAYRLANTYPDAKLLLIHWGTVDAPTSSAFNADPTVLMEHIVNPERILVLAPGEEYRL